MMTYAVQTYTQVIHMEERFVSNWGPCDRFIGEHVNEKDFGVNITHLGRYLAVSIRSFPRESHLKQG